MKVFVDRFDELKILSDLVKTRSRVLILGLRGYGKTALLRKFENVLASGGLNVLYLDCNAVFSPQDLVGFIVEQLRDSDLLDADSYELVLAKSKEMSSKDALETVFKLSKDHNIAGIIFDEISTLIQRFSLLSRTGAWEALLQLPST